MNNNLLIQSEHIQSLNSELKASQDSLESQKASIVRFQLELNKTDDQMLKQNDEIKTLTQQINSMQANITLMQDRIKLLDDRVTLLEQRLKQPCIEQRPPQATKPSTFAFTDGFDGIIRPEWTVKTDPGISISDQGRVLRIEGFSNTPLGIGQLVLDKPLTATPSETASIKVSIRLGDVPGINLCKARYFSFIHVFLRTKFEPPMS